MNKQLFNSIFSLIILIPLVSIGQVYSAQVIHQNNDLENNDKTITISLLKDELWWGGAVNDGVSMPYQEGFTYSNMYNDNKGNQLQPLLISNKGRVIWSEKSFEFTFTKNSISIQAKGELLQKNAGRTLKEAFSYASKKYFAANGKMPDELLFSSPQYNTWIELMYNQNQNDILEYAHAIIDNGFPPGVLMIDDNWQEDHGKWNFHPDRFPNPRKMMEELDAIGFKVMLWVCPFVSPDSDISRELAKNNFLVNYLGASPRGIRPKRTFNFEASLGVLYPLAVPIKNASDAKVTAAPWIKVERPAMVYWWNGVSAVLDLSNPGAENWFKSQLQQLVDEYGVDGFKFDAGDSYFYPDYLVSFKKDITPNEHSELFGKIGLDFPLNEYRATWKMAGLPLVQRLSDKGHNWNDLRTIILNITSQGLMGYAFTCPDMIGGGEFKSFLHTETIDQDLIVRSAQVHSLMPMMQFSVAPWRILDEKHLKAVKKAVQLRKEFTPYIMSLAKEAATTGEPIVRTMEYMYPDQGFERIKDQFMLGEKILVAPVLDKEENKRKVLLPKGKWITGNNKTYRGGSNKTFEVALDELLYFIKQ
ncbi:glycoside hydrolase family 31 protein [Maribacter hydrothermalis]|uniref:Alpha-glucosidase n=1 Tax=Maribacter hydrothermalis TaxID=1836467 RepID=A0A1B7ZF29_9FLAO|nr:glycoside hydrolase family 31 protein [Maribacter hydrothermalis]APQ17567.1 hypothetical protein BTR34_09605 [Maribacter hydrothermalis]OBR42042.1 hypothetical protein A9200_01235 [Maribacter hydrothermalis]